MYEVTAAPPSESPFVQVSPIEVVDLEAKTSASALGGLGLVKIIALWSYGVSTDKLESP